MAIFTVAAVVLAAGRLLPTAQSRDSARKILAGVFLAAVFSGLVRRLLRGDVPWGEVLPIHMCYVSLVMTVLALLTLRRIPFEFAYFFGFGGTIQALLTPDIVSDFPNYEYLAFFAAHGGIIVGVAFLMGAYGLKPERGAILRMFIAGNVYLLIAGAYNALAGTNYGYLCRKPDHPSLLDHIGPWPWYILAVEGIGLFTIVLLDLPFLWFRRRNTSKGPR